MASKQNSPGDGRYQLAMWSEGKLPRYGAAAFPGNGRLRWPMKSSSASWHTSTFQPHIEL